MFGRGLIGYLPAQIAQGVVGLLTIVTFTRLLSPEAYGAYALGFSAMALAHTLTFTWLEAAMARYFAAEAREGGRLGDHFATLYQGWLALALAFPVVCGVALWLWPGGHDVKMAMAAGFAAVLARSLAKLAQEWRRAAGDVRGAALMDLAQTIGGFGLGVGFIFLGLGGAAPLAALGAIAAACLVFTLPADLRHGGGARFERERLRRYASYGIPVSASLILALALATTDRFVLAAFLGEQAVSVYHAGYSLANRTLDVLFIWLGMAGGPALVMALERGGRESLRETARDQAAIMAGLAFPAAVGLALVARPLCEVMVGPALRDGAAQVTPWVAASALFAGFTTYYFHQAFTLGQRTKLLLIAMAVPATLNIVLNLVLVPRFGLHGALWATVASYAVGTLASIALGRRVMPLPIPLEAIGRAAAATALMAMVVLLLPALGGVAELLLKGVVGALVYGVAAAALDVGGIRGRALAFLAARRAGAAA